MVIFITGLAMLLVGAVFSGVGWSIHRRSVLGIEDELGKWLAGVLREWFPILTRRESSGGERLAALGALLAALGIVVTVVGAIAWAK